ncbi:Coiled-coil domain-containing protein 6 [Fasciola hepatica]|uniref:Coiled-coil domain-containing protein 6 n=1 Tax=Fasciola hepatica TaxID=6192 RepID=A0A4E0RWZ2_FASHE|nr:Coiled-coil domain-containing protein 6 [Fasciola hepatica]
MRIEKLETDMNNKQNCLDKLRREKIELENALEQEQEALVNRLWKKMEKLENEKRTLQEKLESLGALLSASSSNQSLASVPQLSTSGNGSIQGGACGLLTHSGSQRPTSSGPGSLRGSLRHQHPQGPPTSLSMTPGLTSPGGAPVVPIQPQSPGQSPCRPLPPPPSVSNTGSGDPRTGYHSQHCQLNQSASLTGELLMVRTSDSTNIAPPQSPMDVDSADTKQLSTLVVLQKTQDLVLQWSRHKPLRSIPFPEEHRLRTTEWTTHVGQNYKINISTEVCSC